MTDQVVEIAPETKVAKTGVKILKRLVIGAVIFGVVAFLGLVVLVETGVLPTC